MSVYGRAVLPNEVLPLNEQLSIRMMAICVLVAVIAATKAVWMSEMAGAHTYCAMVMFPLVGLTAGINLFIWFRRLTTET